jgi:hypothetical protein
MRELEKLWQRLWGYKPNKLNLTQSSQRHTFIIGYNDT